MFTRIGAAWLLAGSLVLGACSSNTITGGGDPAQLSVFNASSIDAGAKLTVDGDATAIPAAGATSLLSLAAGTHTATLVSSTGASLGTTTFTVASGGRRTLIFSGSAAAGVSLSVASDTMTVNNGRYKSIVGSMLLVNTVANAGPFNIRIQQVGTDSIVRLSGFAYGSGSLPPPAPYGYYIPFVPSTYTIDITNSEAKLRSRRHNSH